MALIGILGGSFNPAHSGHIAISNFAFNCLKLEQIWWVIAPLNPLKQESSLIDLSARISYAQKIAKPSFIKVKILETAKQKSYSINLIKQLFLDYPEHKFTWLMGADNLVNFTKWYQYEQFINLINIAIFPREKFLTLPNIFTEKYKKYYINSKNIVELTKIKPPAWSIIPMNNINISATDLRNGKYK